MSVGYPRQMEKQEIILEIGTAYTRVGFVNDNFPRRVLQTKHNLFPSLDDPKQINPILKNHLIRDEKNFEHRVQEFLYQIFYQEILVPTKDKHIYLIYNYFQQDTIINKIALVLYRNYEVSKITFLLGNVLPLYITGQQSGVVIDSGYLQTTLSAAYEGYSLLHLGGRLCAGQHDMAQKLVQRIINDNPQYQFQNQVHLNMIYDREWQEKILTQIGQIIPFQATQKIRQKDDYFLKNFEKAFIKFNFPLTFQLSYLSISIIFADVLFGDPDDEQENLAYNFLQIIRKLNKVEVSKKVLKNIVFTGGLCLLKNFMVRFKEEFQFYLERDFKDLQKVCENIYLTQTQNHPTNLTWIGGSIIAQTNLDQYSFTLTQKQFNDNSQLITTRSDAFNFIPATPVIVDQKKLMQKLG